MSENANYHTTSSVLQKLRSGEAISDKELVIGIESLSPVVDFLRVTGPMFYLNYTYLNDQLNRLVSFRDARKQK